MADRKICAVPGCGKPIDASYNKEMCYAHRFKRLVRQKWLERYRDHDGPGCLIWPFARLKTTGYGVIHRPGGKSTTSAARVMCEMVHGSPPADWYEAAHNCGRGRDGCVHPKHVRWATPVENRGDKRLHGTQYAGVKHYMAKLSEEQVAYIRRMAKVRSQVSIARELGLTTSIVSRVVRGESYV